MKYNGQDNTSIGESAASTSTFVSTDSASAGDLNLEADPNLTSAGNSIAFVDNANPGVDSNLNPELNSLGTTLHLNDLAFANSELGGIALRRNRKNRRRLEE